MHIKVHTQNGLIGYDATIKDLMKQNSKKNIECNNLYDILNSYALNFFYISIWKEVKNYEYRYFNFVYKE